MLKIFCIMAQVIENLKSYFKSVNDRRFLAKFEDKQHFFRVGYSERVRWFEMVGRKERIEALKKGYVCDDGTCQRLFPKYANLVAPYMRLTDEQFALILQEGYAEALEGYVSRHTLSVSQVKALIYATVNRAGETASLSMSEGAKRLPGLLYNYIVREGLPNSLGANVAKLSDERIKAKIDAAINVRYHIMAVKEGYNSDLCSVTDGFQIYLMWMKQEDIQMPYAAEIRMNGRQLASFYQFGHHLSKDAIVYFFANLGEYDNILDLMIENEELYPAWPELEYALESNVLIYKKYQSALCNGKLRKANS